MTIGASSSLVGIGGGLLANMLMTLHGRAVHQAVATSSGIGVLVSLPGALGYMIAGWGKIAIPGPRGLGFLTVYILAPLLGAVAGGGLYMRILRPCLTVEDGKATS